MAIELSEVLGLFRRFQAGELLRGELEGSLAERVLTPATPAPLAPALEEERALAFKLAETVCGMVGPDEEVGLLVGRVIACLEQTPDPGDVLDLLPLITHHDEFSILVSKHVRGLISRAGMRSIISKRFPFDAARPWLESASAERLEALCERLEHGDYRGARSLLVVP